ncbi:beta-ketoacyl reductase, partial [Cryptosporangium sp. NPDC051539]|uniref:beta-ketoacyl reductase n=1 Tax=Cryptosporangium sp. NPDC051539 TaxID=3363962 RepID=UPI0037B6178A
PIETAAGLRLFDAAIASDESLVAPVVVNLPSGGTGVAPLLRGLVRGPRRGTAAQGVVVRTDLVARLAGLPVAEQDRVLTELVREHVATVLGHRDSGAVDARREFRELGFDSLTAIELRNRINAATGLRLTATLIFDHPTPAALGAHLREHLIPPARPRSVLDELEQIEASLLATELDDDTRGGVAVRLRQLLQKVDGRSARGADTSVTERLEQASENELLDFIDHQLGRLNGE